jgi:hypothetical protein
VNSTAVNNSDAQERWAREEEEEQRQAELAEKAKQGEEAARAKRTSAHIHDWTQKSRYMQAAAVAARALQPSRSLQREVRHCG